MLYVLANNGYLDIVWLEDNGELYDFAPKEEDTVLLYEDIWFYIKKD